MGWTTPKTWGSLTTLTATDMNTHVRDNLAYLKALTDAIPFSGAKAARLTARTIATATDQEITLTSQSWDYGDWFTPSSANIIVPAGAIPAGYTTIAVQVIGYFEWAASSGVGSRWIRLKKNATNFVNLSVGGITDLQGQLAIDTVTVVAGDTISVEARQSSGGNIDVNPTYLSVARVAVVS